MSDWPPPGYWRDPNTGKEWRANAAEEREANRLLWKHRDLAGATVEKYLEPEPGHASQLHSQLDLGGQEAER